jgi:hypothetical protein
MIVKNRAAIWGSLFFIVFLFVSAACEDINPAAEKTFNDVKSLLDSADSYQAIGYIDNLGTPDTVAGIYSQLVLDFYWKEKNLPDVITIARAGLQYCLTKADELKSSAPELARELKKKARVISYNLASFTWPGWDEKGIPIGHSDIQIGLDAARLNLRLVKELNEGEDKLAVAYWALGAQLMADQKYSEANAAFAQSKAHARFAGDRMNELLADGYIAINRIITGDEDGNKLLGNAIEELKGMHNEDADFFVEQFNTALNVFIK